MSNRACPAAPQGPAITSLSAPGVTSDLLLRGIWWTGAFAVVWTGLLFREFPSYEGLASAFHEPIVVGFTPANLVIFAVAYLAALDLALRQQLTLPARVAPGIALAAAGIACGVGVGVLHGATELAGDWKNLVMGALVFFFLRATIVRSLDGALAFAMVLIASCAGWSLFLLVRYVLGGGPDNLPVGRTPLFNAGTFQFLIGAIALSLALLMSGRRHLILWCGLTLPMIVIVLSFRRFAWFELVVVALALAFGSFRVRRVSVARAFGGLLVLVVSVAGVLLLSGQGKYEERLATFNPFKPNTSTYASTNDSHVDDIRDGWDQIVAHPVTGLGVGMTFTGERTATWKIEGGMVHNGLLHVWLKFGLLGLLIHLVLHLQVLRELRRRLRHVSPTASALVAAVAVFLIAEFLTTSSFVTWAYAGWEMSVATFALLAIAFGAVRESKDVETA